MEHLDLDVGIISHQGTPNELTTLQPNDATSPMGASNIPHGMPVTPNLGANGHASIQGSKQRNSNYVMIN